MDRPLPTHVGIAIVGIFMALGRPPWISLMLAFSFGAYGVIKKRVPVEAHLLAELGWQEPGREEQAEED